MRKKAKQKQEIMIYETIPAKYLDHSELFQTMHEGFTLKLMYDNQADTLVNAIMTVDSSGDAYKMGKHINVLKNCSEKMTFLTSSPIVILFTLCVERNS